VIRDGAIGDLPARGAGLWAERDALVFGSRRWTFAAFADAVDAAARALVAAGVEPGDKVALWVVNRPEWLFVFYAAIRIGAVVVPLNTRLREDDIRFVLAHAEATTLVQSDRSGPIDFLAQTRAVLPGLGVDGAAAGDPSDPAFPLLRRVITVGDQRHDGALWWDDCLKAGAAVPPDEVAARAAAVDPEATSMIIYTSGTTGFPKGAMHSHRCIGVHASRAERLGTTASDVMLCYLPLFHLYGLAEAALMAAGAGCRLVLTEGFDPGESVRLIEQERVTMLHGFDIHFQGLMEARDRLAADVSSLRLGTIPAGTEAARPVAERILRDFCPVVSTYGLTEGWACTTMGSPADSLEQRTTASGFPTAGYSFRIVDPADGTERPPGEPGEILVRGRVLMQGYYREPDLTADAIDADGWLHTGDMGLLRPDGHLRFLGRYKDMLKVGGENVSPLEVEGYLLESQPLDQIAIVGYPDPRLGEVPVAYVVPAAGCSLGPAELEAAIVDACRGRIASFKIPRRVFVVDALPMTASGKVQKHLLRADVLDRLGAPTAPAPAP